MSARGRSSSASFIQNSSRNLNDKSHTKSARNLRNQKSQDPQKHSFISMNIEIDDLDKKRTLDANNS